MGPPFGFLGRWSPPTEAGVGPLPFTPAGAGGRSDHLRTGFLGALLRRRLLPRPEDARREHCVLHEVGMDGHHFRYIRLLDLVHHHVQVR
jgi:hypothetical protein